MYSFKCLSIQVALTTFYYAENLVKLNQTSKVKSYLYKTIFEKKSLIYFTKENCNLIAFEGFCSIFSCYSGGRVLSHVQQIAAVLSRRQNLVWFCSAAGEVLQRCKSIILYKAYTI